MSFSKQLIYFEERIRLGSMSIKPADFPFNTFLIGYFVGKNNSNIDQMFEIVDLMAELNADRMLPSLLKIQLLNLIDDFPEHAREIVRGLSDYKNGRTSDLFGWISGFYESNKRMPVTQNRSRIQEPQASSPVALNNAQFDGTLELENSDHTEELDAQKMEEQEDKLAEEKDMEYARKLQEQMNNENQKGEEQQVLCDICYCGLYDSPFECLDNCGHFFHIECMSEAFKTNILTNTFPLKCPNVECLKEVTEGDLRRILSKDLFEKYQNHTLKAYAQGHGQSVSWCPTANCGYMFFYEEGDQERFECLECKKDYCLNCRVEWHTDMTCKQYKVSSTMSEDDQKFLEFARGKKFKQCPKCKFWVEKNQGCDHMTCKCKFQFCYKCGGIYMKCECMQKMREQQERRRAQLEERRRRKAQRMSNAASKRAAKNTRAQQKQRRQEELRRQREERDGRQNRSRGRRR